MKNFRGRGGAMNGEIEQALFSACGKKNINIRNLR